MTNDAKLGLILGIGLVIAVAIIFFGADSKPAAKKTVSQAPSTISQRP